MIGLGLHGEHGIRFFADGGKEGVALYKVLSALKDLGYNAAAVFRIFSMRSLSTPAFTSISWMDQ